MFKQETFTMTTKTQTVSNFFLKQQDPTKGIIDFEFLYSGSYVEYFNWLIEGFDSYQKTKLDVLTIKNAKYLFYRYNDILKQNNFEVKKVKHSVEKIQSRDSQYFVESVLDACRANNIGEKN